MTGGDGESVTPKESTVLATPLLDSVIMKDSECVRGLPDSACTDERRSEISGQTNHLLDQLTTPKIGPQLAGREKVLQICQAEMSDIESIPFVIRIAMSVSPTDSGCQLLPL